MTCPTCHKSVTAVKTTIRNNQIVTGCAKCLLPVRGNERANAFEQAEDIRAHRKDIVQPFEADFAKVYGHTKAREYGWSDEALRLLG